MHWLPTFFLNRNALPRCDVCSQPATGHRCQQPLPLNVYHGSRIADRGSRTVCSRSHGFDLIALWWEWFRTFNVNEVSRQTKRSYTGLSNFVIHGFAFVALFGRIPGGEFSTCSRNIQDIIQRERIGVQQRRR
ncbi:uncharacterized protein LOC143149443 isoform X1 [Ptiloglossa arizonensis]|uniref:uncharacterized protein LOC143149443 isoform X1 n=1 Tax=Ptiloglossa arizonensis TaxID=3350558 RepID=UPI003FA00707